MPPLPDSAQIRAAALRLGFDACGIAPPLLEGLEREHHAGWLARGHAAGMDYLARRPDERYDAGSLLPDCRSVVVCALSYYNAGSTQPHGGTGKLSRYCWGDDYHDVMADKLKTLAYRLAQDAPDLSWKVCVDTSPLNEKAFAVRAGLGWHGRNSLVLSAGLGSYFFIGLLLTSLPLAPDTPVADGCAACSLCVNACPTGALLGPGILDARRCVSYHSTERREAADSSVKLNGWLYGCDTCQEVCPFNSQPKETREPRLWPRAETLSLSAERVLELDEDGFERLSRGTVLRRRRLFRLRAQAENLLSAAGREG